MPSVIINDSFIEWPGHVSCVLFWGGCNVTCPYCHNVDLNAQPPIQKQEFKERFDRVAPYVDGVVFTGGEALLHDMRDVIALVDEKKLKKKIHTNGSIRADEVLEKFDCVAMDFKCINRKDWDAFGWSEEYQINNRRLLEQIYFRPESEIHVTVTHRWLCMEQYEHMLALLKPQTRLILQRCHPVRSEDDEVFKLVAEMASFHPNLSIR